MLPTLLIMTYNDTYTPGEKEYRPIPPPDHWGYNTLLMVSTKDSTVKGKVYHRDYYIDINAKMKTAVKPGFIVSPPIPMIISGNC
jgi:hypothetical protein